MINCPSNMHLKLELIVVCVLRPLFVEQHVYFLFGVNAGQVAYRRLEYLSIAYIYSIDMNIIRTGNTSREDLSIILLQE